MWFDVPEVDTLTALIGRQASTTSSELRKMFSGEALGFQNSDATRRKIAPSHSYRAALVAGVADRTVRRWIADEVLPSVKLGGARLVPRKALERLMSLPSWNGADSAEEIEQE